MQLARLPLQRTAQRLTDLCLLGLRERRRVDRHCDTLRPLPSGGSGCVLRGAGVVLCDAGNSDFGRRKQARLGVPNADATCGQPPRRQNQTRTSASSPHLLSLLSVLVLIYNAPCSSARPPGWTHGMAKMYVHGTIPSSVPAGAHPHHLSQ